MHVLTKPILIVWCIKFRGQFWGKLFIILHSDMAQVHILNMKHLVLNPLTFLIKKYPFSKVAQRYRDDITTHHFILSAHYALFLFKMGSFY